jgi:hypothetical protein
MQDMAATTVPMRLKRRTLLLPGLNPIGLAIEPPPSIVPSSTNQTGATKPHGLSARRRVRPGSAAAFRRVGTNPAIPVCCER